MKAHIKKLLVLIGVVYGMYMLSYVDAAACLKVDRATTCFSHDCDKSATIRCKACNDVWYCSSDCKGYQEHIRICDKVLLKKGIRRMFKKIKAQQANPHGPAYVPATPLEKGLAFQRKCKVLGITKCEETAYVQIKPALQRECKLCKANTKKKCIRCCKVFYCSQVCQASDWKEHKKTCDDSSYEKKRHDKKGLYDCFICKLASLVSNDEESDFFKEHKKHCGKPHCTYCEKLIDKLLQCSRCKSVLYCSRECQKSHWKSGHNKACVASTGLT